MIAEMSSFLRFMPSFTLPGLLRCFQSLGPFVLAPLPGLCLSEKGREPYFTRPGSSAFQAQLLLSGDAHMLATQISAFS